jgi:hypothetical protein
MLKQIYQLDQETKQAVKSNYCPRLQDNYRRSALGVWIQTLFCVGLGSLRQIQNNLGVERDISCADDATLYHQLPASFFPLPLCCLRRERKPSGVSLAQDSMVIPTDY